MKLIPYLIAVVMFCFSSVSQAQSLSTNPKIEVSFSCFFKITSNERKTVFNTKQIRNINLANNGTDIYVKVADTHWVYRFNNFEEANKFFSELEEVLEKCQ